MYQGCSRKFQCRLRDFNEVSRAFQEVPGSCKRFQGRYCFRGNSGVLQGLQGCSRKFEGHSRGFSGFKGRSSGFQTARVLQGGFKGVSGGFKG